MTIMTEARFREIIREELKLVVDAVIPEQGKNISIVVDGDVFTAYAETGLRVRTNQERPRSRRRDDDYLELVVLGRNVPGMVSLKDAIERLEDR